MLGGDINAMRKELGLPQVNSAGLNSVPILNIFSQKVVPRPQDYPPQVIETGYWILPPVEDYEPHPDLADFLHDEDLPVYIGFGSMPVKNKDELVQMFGRALSRLGLRGVYCAGWSDMEGIEVPENIMLVKDVPHEWLFPRCAMAFHHGGAGTTAASLRAGIPTVILPVLVDQPFWASRVVDLGVGQNDVCMLRDVTEDFLFTQARQCISEASISKARQLGQALRQEDGVTEAASYIVSYAEKRKAPAGLEFDYKPDSSAQECTDCKAPFTFFFRRHHCMSCGNIACSKCLKFFDLVNYESWRYCCRSCADARNWNFESQP
jgi:sterol 3beta-glucosyltransferase